MSLDHMLAGADLYDETMADIVWPPEKRIIYCSVTGRPWGHVHPDYVKELVMLYGRADGDKSYLQTMIERMTLFNGPSPLWQSKTDGMLAQNKVMDPAGFLVYMLNRIFEPERNSTGDLEKLVQWRKDMVALYSGISKHPRALIENVNDVLLMLSGDGLLPPYNAMPSQHIADYADKDILVRLIAYCKNWYTARKNYKPHNLQGGKSRQQANVLHKRAALRAANIETLDAKAQQNVAELMLLSLFAEIDSTYSPKDVRKAKSKTGISSGLFADLNKLGAQEIERHKANLAQKLTPTKSQFVRITAGAVPTLGFLKKKDA